MQKLTNKSLDELESILKRMERGINYLMKNETVICSRKPMKTTTLDFNLPDGSVATEVCKDIGSELCLLFIAQKDLKDIIARNRKG